MTADIHEFGRFMTQLNLRTLGMMPSGPGPFLELIKSSNISGLHPLAYGHNLRMANLFLIP